MRVVVAGAGFGGLEVATSVAQQWNSSRHSMVLIDQAAGFTPGSAHLDLVCGAASRDQVSHRYADLAAGSAVEFRRARITGIDPDSRTVRTDGGDIAADVLVVALGAEVDPAFTPGLVAYGHEFYTAAGAERAGAALHEFASGAIVIGAAAGQYKCPPAPSALAIRLHEVLVERGLRSDCSITVALPGASPIPPAPRASVATLEAFERCDIDWVPNVVLTALSNRGHTAEFSTGLELPSDLFLAVPRHRAPVAAAPLLVDGWIPVDEETCMTSFPQVYALGDVTSMGTPKAGAFAARQAAAVADRIVAASRGDDSTAVYDGAGACYMGFDGGQFARIGVTVRHAAGAVPEFDGPSVALAEQAAAAGSAALGRWFRVGT